MKRKANQSTTSAATAQNTGDNIGNNIGDNTGDNTLKDPKNWVTGGEPMTGAQRSYLHTLAQETHTEVSDDLSKGEASQKINELKQIDPRTNGNV